MPEIEAFELMELSTGNLIGVYLTQEAALHDVAVAIECCGAEAVATLALSTLALASESVIAEGAALADLALRD